MLATKLSGLTVDIIANVNARIDFLVTWQLQYVTRTAAIYHDYASCALMFEMLAVAL